MALVEGLERCGVGVIWAEELRKFHLADGSEVVKAVGDERRALR